MKCIVCGREHEKNECPVCKFQKVEFPGDPEKGLQAMRPAIEAYREDFLGKVSVGIIAYQWRDDNGAFAMDRKERVPIGTGKERRESARWLDEKFARIPEEEQLLVNLSVRVNDMDEERSVGIPNLTEPELQELGASVDGDLNIQLLLRNSSGSTQSEKIPLFR